jgi:hypothetical protein
MNLVYEGRGVRIYEPEDEGAALIEVHAQRATIIIPVNGDFYDLAKANFDATAREVLHRRIQAEGGEPIVGVAFGLEPWPEDAPSPIGAAAEVWRVLTAEQAFWPSAPEDVG